MRLCSRLLLASVALLFLAPITSAQDKAPSSIENADEAVQLAQQHQPSLYANYESQLTKRLFEIDAVYQYTDRDAKLWESVFNDEANDIYARMCAATFIYSSSLTAREFIDSCLTNDSFRIRNNAAFAIHKNITVRKSLAWHRAVELLKSKTLEDVSDTPLGGGEEVGPAIGMLAKKLCLNGDISITPLLLEVFKRTSSRSDRHARYMSEGFEILGDPRAVTCIVDFVEAFPPRLSYLNLRIPIPLLTSEAAPLFTSLLGVRCYEHVERIFANIEDRPSIAKYLNDDFDDIVQHDILFILMHLRATSAIPAIIDLRDSEFSEKVTEDCNYVLKSLQDDNRENTIIELLEGELNPEEFEKLVFELSYYRTMASNSELDEIIHHSKCPSRRWQAINAICHISGREIALKLVELLDLEIPPDLEGDASSKEAILQLILSELKIRSGLDCGSDIDKWRAVFERE